MPNARLLKGMAPYACDGAYSMLAFKKLRLDQLSVPSVVLLISCAFAAAVIAPEPMRIALKVNLQFVM